MNHSVYPFLPRKIQHQCLRSNIDNNSFISVLQAGSMRIPIRCYDVITFLLCFPDNRNLEQTCG